MNRFAINAIDTLGGSTAVSRLIDSPITTVQSWKQNGIPPSRLAHLKLVAEKEAIAIDWDTGLPPEAADTASSEAASATKGREIICSEAAE